MTILQPLHAALLVSDLEQSAWFYGTVLELPLDQRPLKFPGLWYQIGDFQIHLIASTLILPDRVNAEKWGRNRHLAFAVKDLDTLKSRLMEYGCPVQMSASGRAALFTQDPDGNILELSQAKYSGMQMN